MERNEDSPVGEEDDQQIIVTAHVEPKSDRSKRRKVRVERNGGCDDFEKKCLQLEREYDDFQKEILEGYLRRHWLTGIRIFVNRPIHSAYVCKNPDSQTIANVQLRMLMMEACYVGATEAESVFDKPTHVIVYHKDGQEIPYRNILRSLGGQTEQDMVKFSQFLSSGGEIKIVYHTWLDASLKAKTVLPLEDYEVVA